MRIRWTALLIFLLTGLIGSAQVPHVHRSNATLQGGLFQRNDPHTLEADDVERVVPGYEAGARLSFRSIDLSYSENYIGRTFDQGLRHGWGTCDVRVWF